MSTEPLAPRRADAGRGEWLEEQLARKTEEVRILRGISSAINKTLDLDEICDIVLRTMDELFGFGHALVLLAGETERVLTVVAARGYPDPPLGARVPFGAGLIGVVAERRRPMRLGHLGQKRAYMGTIRRGMERAGRIDELVDAPALPGLPRVESQIAIPLMIESELIGVFHVESEKQRNFSERDELLTAIVANQAAAAIQNGRLFGAVERRVRERTEALERANRELQDTQAQLFQSAKLAALGDLVAGLAHEINTPLGSIQANTDLARRVVRIVSSSLEGGGGDGSDEALRGKLARALASLEDSAASTLSATSRIATLVRSLRNFARLDEAERKRVDLHEGVDSALSLLRHQLDGRIAVVRDYGELPPLECFPHRLNQVFMNLLVNAIEAVERRGGGGTLPLGTITIATRRDAGVLELRFTDSGCGIPPENVGRLFDPGFTTKGRGVGTGLGLSISYRVVEDHGGSIHVESEPDVGSSFTLRLPLTA